MIKLTDDWYDYPAFREKKQESRYGVELVWIIMGGGLFLRPRVNPIAKESEISRRNTIPAMIRVRRD